MSDYSFDIKPLFWIGVGLTVIVFMIIGLIDLVFIPEKIKSTSPIVPTIELVIEDNQVDTLYVYTQPK